MQQFNLYYTRKERINMFFNSLVYLVFLIYTTNLLLSNIQDPFNWFMGLIAFAFLSFGILKEILNFQFKKAVYLLTIKCDPKSGLNQVQIVERFDLFKSFDSTCLTFRILVHLDLRDCETLEAFLKNLPSDQIKDIELVNAYALFKISVFKQNKTQMKKAFTNLNALKDIKQNNKAVFSPLFIWEDIEAEYEFRMNDFKKANSLLNKANLSVMNPRELAQHALLQANVFIQLGKTKEALGLYNEVVLLSPLNAYGIEAQELVNVLEEVPEISKINR